MKYKVTSLILGVLIFFSLGTIDKIIAQTPWDAVDITFAICTSILSGLFLYLYKNKL